MLWFDVFVEVIVKTKVLILDKVASRATLGTRIHFGKVSFESSLDRLFSKNWALFQQLQLVCVANRNFCARLENALLITLQFSNVWSGVLIFLMTFAQLEVIEHVTGYNEFDVMKNKQVDSVALNYPPSVLRTIGVVSLSMLLDCSHANSWNYLKLLKDCTLLRFTVKQEWSELRIFEISSTINHGARSVLEWSFYVSLVYLSPLLWCWNIPKQTQCNAAKFIYWWLQVWYFTVVGFAGRGDAKAEAYGAWCSTCSKACSSSSSCCYDHE